MIQNYGFDPKTISIEPEHYVLGGLLSLPQIILQPDGQWDASMPTYKPQFGIGWDSDGCTIWGTLNAEEFLEKKRYGGEPNHSERHVYIGTHTRPPGNDPHVIAEWVRANGVIDDSQLPMTSTYEEFIAPDPLPQTLTLQGKLWATKRYTYGHEWVFKGDQPQDQKIALMKQSLQYSPLGVAVTAWFQDNDGIFRDHGQPNCHWCVCFGWDDVKRAWKIFDSYDQTVKLYSFDSAISFCKRYSLVAVPAVHKQTIAEFLEALFHLFK